MVLVVLGGFQKVCMVDVELVLEGLWMVCMVCVVDVGLVILGLWVVCMIDVMLMLEGPWRPTWSAWSKSCLCSRGLGWSA